MRGVLENRSFHFASFAIALAIGLAPYFLNGTVLLGGDGDYHMSFTGVLRYWYAWAEDGTGVPNYASGAVWPLPAVLSIIEGATGDIAIVKFVLYFFICFLYFLSAYLVSTAVGLTPLRSYLISLFFALNPFSLTYLGRLNMSLTVVPAAMLVFFWTILKSYENNAKLFFLFGAVSSLFAFANTNPPLLAVMQASILLSVFIVSWHMNGEVKLREASAKYALVLASFILFNFWWLLNLFSFVTSGAASQMYTKETAGSFLDLVISTSGTILPRILTLRTGFPADPGVNFLGAFYNSTASVALSGIPLLLAGAYAAASRQTKAQRLIMTVFILSLAAAFLAKGTGGPFGIIYGYLFTHLPFFNIFKGPLEKFGVLFLFLFTLLLVFLAKEADGLFGKAFNAVFGVYALFFSIPLLSGNLFPETRIGVMEGYTWSEDVETLKYRERDDYRDTREYIAKDPHDFRVLTFPGNESYYASTFRMYGNRLYSGVDPLFSNTGKPFLIYGAGTKELYEDGLDGGFSALLSVHNVKYVSLNKASVPRYGFAGGHSLEGLESSLGAMMESKRFGEIILYDAGANYLPRIYIPGAQE